MATKVFLRFNRDIRDVYVKGREYEVLQRTDGLIRAKSELGIEFFDFETNKKYFDVIEREDSTTFEAHGHTWTRHTPGDPMPCDGDAVINWLTDDELKVAPKDLGVSARSCELCWRLIIGWRFADSAKPEQADRPITGIIKRVCAEYSERHDQYQNFAWLEFLKLAAPDVAAVEDTSLPPRHRKIVNAKEDAQAARERAEAEALAKSEQEKADRLKRDGEALSRDFDNQHGHRMGWLG